MERGKQLRSQHSSFGHPTAQLEFEAARPNDNVATQRGSPNYSTTQQCSSTNLRTTDTLQQVVRESGEKSLPAEGEGFQEDRCDSHAHRESSGRQGSDRSHTGPIRVPPKVFRNNSMSQRRYEPHSNINQGPRDQSDPGGDRSERYGNKNPLRQYSEPAGIELSGRETSARDQFCQHQSYANVKHLTESEPEYPVINRRAFLVLSIIQAICSFLMLICGIVVAVSNSGRRSINGTEVCTVSVVHTILSAVTVAFGILNYKAATECKVITGIVLSVFCSVGSLAPAALGASNALECRHFSYHHCPSHVTGLSGLLVFLSLVICTVAVVHSSFACRAMCCLPPQRVTTADMPTNNNFEERSTKM